MIPASTLKAAAAGYNMLLAAGFDEIYSPEMAAPGAAGAAGAVLLELFWHEARKDNFTTASPQGKADARAAGYKLVGTESWVWETEAAVPLPSGFYTPWALSLYWNANHKDNMLVLEGLIRNRGPASRSIPSCVMRATFASTRLSVRRGKEGILNGGETGTELMTRYMRLLADGSGVMSFTYDPLNDGLAYALYTNLSLGGDTVRFTMWWRPVAQPNSGDPAQAKRQSRRRFHDE